MDVLSKARKAKGMTQRELAAKSGVSIQMISMIENGNRRPSVDKAQQIASVLGFDWTLFFKGEEESA